MKDAIVRLAGPADLPAIVALRRASAEETAGGPIADADFDQRLADWYQREAGRRLVWLGEFAGEPVGMLNLTVFERMPQPGRDAGRWGHIGNAFVLARVRNLGIGRRLLDAAIQHARNYRFERVVLNPSERSVPLYMRAGFAPAHALLRLDLTS